MYILRSPMLADHLSGTISQLFLDHVNAPYYLSSMVFSYLRAEECVRNGKGCGW